METTFEHRVRERAYYLSLECPHMPPAISWEWSVREQRKADQEEFDRLLGAMVEDLLGLVPSPHAGIVEQINAWRSQPQETPPDPEPYAPLYIEWEHGYQVNPPLYDWEEHPAHAEQLVLEALEGPGNILGMSDAFFTHYEPLIRRLIGEGNRSSLNYVSPRPEGWREPVQTPSPSGASQRLPAQIGLWIKSRPEQEAAWTEVAEDVLGKPASFENGRGWTESKPAPKKRVLTAKQREDKNAQARLRRARASNKALGVEKK